MANKLIKDGTIISWDNDAGNLRILDKASILITNDRIAAIAEHDGDLPTEVDVEVIDATGMILTPGFISGHSHMWQTAFRSMAPDVFIAQYFGWLSQMGSATKSFSASDVYTSCLEGYCEGLNAGTTSYVEHASSNWSDDMVDPSYQAAKDSGARIWWSHDLPAQSTAQVETLKKIKGDIVKEKGLVSMGLAPDMFHWEQSDALQRVKDLIGELQPEVVTTHYLGGPWRGVGVNSPAIAAQKGLRDLKTPIIFSHGGFVTKEDIDALRSEDNFLCITPENEMSEGHGQSTSRLVHDHAALGTDTNWNISGDILHNARLWLQSVRAASYQKVLDQGRTPRQNPMSVVDAFLLATRQGALALRRNDLGVLRVGAKADIVCFDGESPNMAGWTNAVAAVVLHSNIGDIKHVLVDGQFRKRDGRLLTKTRKWEDIRDDFKEVARRIQTHNADPPPIPPQFWGGGEYGDVEQAGTQRKK